MRETPRLGRVVRWLKYRMASRALILTYHRVTDLSNDPHLLAVRPRHFAEQLELIRRHGNPIALSALVGALRHGKIPDRAVIITFDDGYADNLHQAKPLLERYEIPATVFVTAGQVKSQREFWWDELDRLFLQPGTLPAKLRLNFNGSACEWELGEASIYTEQDCRRYGDWHVERQYDPSSRHRLFRCLYGRLHSLPDAGRREMLDDLRAWAGAEPAARVTHRTLTEDEVILLADGDLTEVGAHTMTHPVLAAIPAAEQRKEIEQSKEFLESILKHPVTSFAFPHGSSTAETVAILKETGFLCACSTHPSAVWPGANCFQLPRVGVRDWDGETFERWLRWWIDG
jgi:peptidoglycan/xylan/chitin deacetylase (PgdA/CDA1 family)